MSNNLDTQPQFVHSEKERRLLNKDKLQELMSQVDRRHTLDDHVQDILCDIADDFMIKVIDFSCRIAKGRQSKQLDVHDINLCLERNWNIFVPGYSIRQTGNPFPNERLVEEDELRKKLVQNHQVKFLRKKKLNLERTTNVNQKKR